MVHPTRTRRVGPNRRDKWRKAVQQDRQLAAGTRLFLVATLAPKMSAEGFVSHPRKRLADLAGVSERQVTKYFARAVERGWLVVVGRGVRGHTAEYQATFPDQIAGTTGVSLSRPNSGNSTNPLSAGTPWFPLTAEIAGTTGFPPVVPIGTRRQRPRQMHNGDVRADHHRHDEWIFSQPTNRPPRRGAPRACSVRSTPKSKSFIDGRNHLGPVSSR